MSFKFQQPVDWQQIWFDFKSQPDSQRRPEREREGPNTLQMSLAVKFMQTMCNIKKP